MKFETIELPTFLASWFINADNSSFVDSDELLLLDVQNTLNELNYTDCVNVSDESFFGRFNGMGHDMSEFTFRVEK